MLKVSGIDVFYGDLQVLWDVSFDVKEKEILVLVGANGAGKSTTIKTISSLLTPREGTIEFNDIRLDHLPPHKIIEHGIVHVPEGRHLFAEMTVEENLLMGALHGEAKVRRPETLEYVYRIFSILKERRGQTAGSLSGGEQQMLAIGRGLMSRPKLMMFDEPSLGLKRINEEGVTVLLVEQNVVQTLALCNRACVLENGRIVLQGKGQELVGNDHVKKAYLGV